MSTVYEDDRVWKWGVCRLNQDKVIMVEFSHITVNMLEESINTHTQRKRERTLRIETVVSMLYLKAQKHTKNLAISEVRRHRIKSSQGTFDTV